MANGRTRKWENSEEGKAWKKEYQQGYQQDYKDKVQPLTFVCARTPVSWKPLMRLAL